MIIELRKTWQKSGGIGGVCHWDGGLGTGDDEKSVILT